MMLSELADKVNANETLQHLGRFCSVEFVIAIGDVPYHILVDKGRIREVVTGPFKMRSFSFAIRADEAAWREFRAPVPKPGYHDIFAMASSGYARIEGDMAPLLHNLRYIKEVLAVMRERD